MFDSRKEYRPKNWRLAGGLCWLLLILPSASPALAHGSCASDKICLRDLIPSKSRWGRGFSFTASWIDQAEMRKDSAGNTVPNPDDELQKFTVSLDLSKTIWSTDELVAAYELASADATKKYIDTGDFQGHFVARESSPLRFFARARPGDFGRRLASAWSFSTGQSQRPAPLVPMQGDDDYEETYAAEFDPRKLTLSADRVRKAYKGLAAYTKVHAVESGLPPCKTRMNSTTKKQECAPLVVGHPVEKLREVSGIRVAKQGKIAAIPKITYETKDEFDFIEAGGVFVRDPTFDGMIETLSITWDLKAALDTAAQRRAALSALALHQKQLESDFALRQALGIAGLDKLQICSGRFVYHTLKAENAFGTAKWKGAAKWKGPPEKDSGLALGASDGLLQGNLTGGGTLHVTVCLTDGSSRSAAETWKFDVQGCAMGTKIAPAPCPK